MVIDCHAHWFCKDFSMAEDKWKDFISEQINGQFYKDAGVNMSDEAVAELLLAQNGEELAQQFADTGIDKRIFMPLDYYGFYGEPNCDTLEMNRRHAEVAKAYPGQMYSLFGIDPRRENAAKHFYTAVTEWGMIGLKLYPPSGFLPSDPVCDELYKLAIELDVPVLSHGSEQIISPNEECHPRNFLPVLQRFPQLKLVGAHAGGFSWFEEVVDFLNEFENYHVDLSCWQILPNDSLIDRMDTIMEKTGSLNKVMFGTDSPSFDPVFPLKEWVARAKALPYSSDQIDALMSGNAAKLFKI